MTLTNNADVTAYVNDLVAQCNKAFGSYVPNVKVSWFPAGKAAGEATRKGMEYSIRLNAQLWKHPDELLNTIKHEVAHLIVFCMRLRGVSQDGGHGRDWKRVHRFLGGTAERCHTLDLGVARKTKQYVYVCHSGTVIKVGAAKHKKIQAGQVRRLRKTKEHFGAKHYVPNYVASYP